MTEYLNVGKIVNTHGIRGEVRVISQTDFPEERYKKGAKLTLFKQGVKPLELTITSHRKHKNFDLLTFEGFTNVNEVIAWKESILKIDETQLTALKDGEFYFHEIIGCDVFTEERQLIGTVKEILAPGANDVWVVQLGDKKEVYIPYIPQVVKEIDVEQKEIIITPMEGLLE